MISAVSRSLSTFAIVTVMLVATWGGASRAAAETITVAWDPNREPDLAGYVVSVGSRSGVADRTIDVGSVTSSRVTVSAGCVYVRVQAYNRSGLFSAYSNEVRASVGGTGYCDVAPPPPPPPPPGPSPDEPGSGGGGGSGGGSGGTGGTGGSSGGGSGGSSGGSGGSATGFSPVVPISRPAGLRLTGDANRDGLDDGWAAAYGVTSPAADDDRDGLTNLQEAAAGTDPTLPNVLTFAEGSTSGFVERIALFNPGLTEAVADVEFLSENGARVARRTRIDPLTRQSVMVNTVLGAVPGHGTTVRVLRGGVAAERTMWWGAPDGGVPGHTGGPAPSPAKQWYFAEGDAGTFDTYLLLTNPQKTAASVTVRFLIEGRPPHTQSFTVKAGARLTVASNTIQQLRGRSFGMHVASSVPIVAERAMYFGGRAGAWRGGHETPGVTALSTSWFIAEGRTGAKFDTYILLGNPQSAAVNATLRYLTPSGAAGSRTVTIAAYGRVTVHLDLEKGLYERDVSVQVTASRPIVVERAMYWPGTPATWQEGHASTGVTAAARRWVLAEGEVGGSLASEMFVLVANPGSRDASVSVTFADSAGRLYRTLANVPAGSRATASSTAIGLPPGTYGILVEATAPVIVERSSYWSAGGSWRGGSNQVGQPAGR